MDELRVLHAADLHIDSPMRGLVGYEGAPVDEIRSATRSACRALVAEAIDRRVHLVVVAGDLYDGAWRDYNTGLFVVSQLAELHEAGIPVVLVYGNHDAESQLTTRLRLPPNTTVLASGHPERHLVTDVGVAVYGQSYATRAVTADLAQAYPVADPGLVTIGLLHTCFDGSLGHDPYAPCTLAGLRSKRYDYWALGHVHRHTVVCADPMVVFPGNVQGRHARETGPKGAVLVTFAGGAPQVEHLSLDVVRWERCLVDVAGARSVDECLERCRDGLVALCDAGAATYAVRVELDGRTVVHGDLQRMAEHLTAEIRALSLSLGPDIWIEKVVTSTAPPPARQLVPEGGVAAEIGRVLADLKADTTWLSQKDGAPLQGLPSLQQHLRAEGGTGWDEAAIVASIDDAADLLLAMLEAEGVTDAH